jgi:hypothetical protein
MCINPENLPLPAHQGGRNSGVSPMRLIWVFKRYLRRQLTIELLLSVKQRRDSLIMVFSTLSHLGPLRYSTCPIHI